MTDETEPDATGCYHNRIHEEQGGRPAKTPTRDDDVPAGYWVSENQGDIEFPFMWGPEGRSYVQSRDAAIAACREHARRVAEGSELVAELRAEVNDATIEKAGLRNDVERVAGQRDEALREMEAAQRRVDALEAEVEKLKQLRGD